MEGALQIPVYRNDWSTIDRAVLVVDSDQRVLALIADGLRGLDVRVVVATSGARALELASAERFRLVLSELRLDDMPGTDLVRRLTHSGSPARIVFMGALPKVNMVVAAMRCGAVDVIEKPVRPCDLIHYLQGPQNAPVTADAAETMRLPESSILAEPRSVAERWVSYVLKACTSEGDLKTLGDWARYVGVSCTTLSEGCRLVGIRPQDARNFMRVLRVILLAPRHGCPPDILLDISDRRTLKSLLRRAGLDTSGSASVSSASDFIRKQQYVPQSNQCARLLDSYLSSGNAAADLRVDGRS
jgi:FixJ family two-component response regulator